MNRFHFLGAALITMVLVTTGCLSTADSKTDYVPLSTDTLKGSGKLYLVPLGGFSQARIAELAGYYRSKYGITIETLPDIPLPSEAINPARHQLIAEAAVDVMTQSRLDVSIDPEAIMIGLTTQDMYIAQYNWSYSFSFRKQDKYAVVSTARMDDSQTISFWDIFRTKPGPPAPGEVIQTRLRKMVTKNIGILYYHLPQSADRRSVLYRKVSGIYELDDMGEEF
jgi:predicted Zn-dependent protease